MRFLCGTHEGYSLYSLSSSNTEAGSILVSLTSHQPESTKNLYTDKRRVWINQAFYKLFILSLSIFKKFRYVVGKVTFLIN